MFKKSVSIICLMLLAFGLDAFASDKVLDSLRRYYYKVEPTGDYYIVSQGLFTTLFDSDGKAAFPFRYKTITHGLGDDFIADNSYLIDGKGNRLARIYGEPFEINERRGIYKTRQHNSVYVYHRSGKLLVPGIDTVHFKKGLFTIWNEAENREVALDTNGNRIDFGAGRIISTCSKYILTKRGDSVFALNTHGKLLFGCLADDGKLSENCFIAVKLFGQWALKDERGKTLTG